MHAEKKMTQDSYDAFISYRHQSGFYMAQVIYDKLVQNGYSVFMDKRLEKGEYEQQIKAAIESSRNFILVLFPKDLDDADSAENWLCKEAQWAVDTPNINYIPVFCEGFRRDTVAVELPQCLETVLRSQGVIMHKDYSLDADLDKLCDQALENANPVKPQINTISFFHSNLNEKNYLTIKGVDMAFHGGGAWFRPGAQKDILDSLLRRKIPTRVLVNTPEAAQSIARHMHDEDAIYTSFEDVVKHWKRWQGKYADTLQVRVCPIALLRVYHNIRFREDAEKNSFDRMHIKYYVYQNMNLEKSFEHEISSFSAYYELYQKEFEYLWNASTPISE